MLDIANHHRIGCVESAGKRDDGAVLVFAGDGADYVCTETKDGVLRGSNLAVGDEHIDIYRDEDDGSYTRMRAALGRDPAWRSWCDPFMAYRLFGIPLEQYVAVAADAYPRLPAPTSTAGWTQTCCLCCTRVGGLIEVVMRPFPGLATPERLWTASFDPDLGCLTSVRRVVQSEQRPDITVEYADFVRVHGVPLPRTLRLREYNIKDPALVPLSTSTVTWERFNPCAHDSLPGRIFKPPADAVVEELLD
jgi:hypothetical protein